MRASRPAWNSQDLTPELRKRLGVGFFSDDERTAWAYKVMGGLHSLPKDARHEVLLRCLEMDGYAMNKEPGQGAPEPEPSAWRHLWEWLTKPAW